MEGPSRSEVWKMFDAISETYDTVNRLMTFGIDKAWRRKVARFLPERSGIHLLDCATGTGDQIFELISSSAHIKKAVGIDLAESMLEIGRKKLARKSCGIEVSLECASALALPFPDASFDCATISFGIRNLTDTALGLREMHRVLNPGGRALILECSIPQNPLMRQLNNVYIRHLLPRLGGLISKQKAAYVYLNKTIETFPSGDAFCSLLENAGFINVQAHPFTFGVVTLYSGEKP